MDIALITVSCILLAIIIPMRYLLNSEIERCRYGLYKVRDDLIYYVATGKLNEESPIFNYYYNFINEVINNRYNLKVENFIKILLSGQDSHQSEELLKEIKQELSKQNNDVHDTIIEFYFVMTRIIYTNGNFITALYLVMRKILGISVIKFLTKPKTIKAVQLANKEANILSSAIETDIKVIEEARH